MTTESRSHRRRPTELRWRNLSSTYSSLLGSFTIVCRALTQLVHWLSGRTSGPWKDHVTYPKASRTDGERKLRWKVHLEKIRLKMELLAVVLCTGCSQIASSVGCSLWLVIITIWETLQLARHHGKSKGFPYPLPSIGPWADPGVQAVSPHLAVSHPPGGRLPLLSARPAVTFPAAEHRRPLAGTKLWRGKNIANSGYMCPI